MLRPKNSWSILWYPGLCVASVKKWLEVWKRSPPSYLRCLGFMSSKYADWITYESSDVWIVFFRHLQDIMIHQDNLWYDFVVLIWYRKLKFELCIYSLFFIMICNHLFLYFHANLRLIFDAHEFLLSLACYSFQYLAFSVSCLCWINKGWRGRFPPLSSWQCLVRTCSNCRSRQTKTTQTDTGEGCEQRYEVGSPGASTMQPQ